MKYVFLDTSALMHSPETIEQILENEEAKALVCSVVMDELDKHKDFGDGERNYKARQAFKLISKLEKEDKISYIIDETSMLPGNFNPNVPDNKILASLLYNIKINPFSSSDYYLLTYDNGMKVKAKMLQINLLEFGDVNEEQYKGYIEIYGTQTEIDEQLAQIIKDKNMLVNQYIIMHEIELDEKNDVIETTYVGRWDGDTIVDCYTPKKSPIEPMNGPQQCAIDLMYNKEIPVKIICGGYGSGKTFIAVKTGEDLINRYTYSKLMLVRNPVPADDIDIGALPGDKHDKVGSYFKSMTQYLTDFSQENEDSFDPANEMAAKQRGYELIMEIPSFMKGISVEETLMIVDECEDLNVKLIKMLGTRLGKDSAVVFTGDYHQSEKKYKTDSGMNKMIEEFKGNPLVGIVVLEEDVRSSVSKIFAKLDN